MVQGTRRVGMEREKKKNKQHRGLLFFMPLLAFLYGLSISFVGGLIIMGGFSVTKELCSFAVEIAAVIFSILLVRKLMPRKFPQMRNYSFERPNWYVTAAIVLLMPLFIAAENAIVYLISFKWAAFEYETITYTAEELTEDLVKSVSAVFLAPIYEEISFRFMPLTVYKKKGARIAVCVIMSALFAWLHGGNWMAVFIDAVVYSALFLTTKNIWVSICAHACNNLYATVLAILSYFGIEGQMARGTTMILIPPTAVMVDSAVMAAAGVAVIIYGRRKYKEEKERNELEEKARVGSLVIGTKIISGTDESRTEKLGPAAGGRCVTARLYYPAKFNGEKAVEFPKMAAGEMYENAELCADGKLPLIVYNPGYGAYVEINNRLCCELVEHGYFVVSVGHAYESDKFVMEDGTVIAKDKSVKKKIFSPMLKGILASAKLQKVTGSPEQMYEQFDAFQRTYSKFMMERIPEWAADTEFIVGLLKKDYSDCVDFESGIGATGHSFGGNTAYYLCMNNDEYVCGVNIDGGIFGDFTGQRMKKPFLQICHHGNESVVSRALFDTDAPVEYEVFENLTHMGFTDLKFFKKSKSAMGTMPADEMYGRLKALHFEFFDKYLRKGTKGVKRKYIVDKSYVDASGGTWFYEFSKGRLEHKEDENPFWKENSVFIEDMTVTDLKIDRLFAKVLEDYDSTGETFVNKEQWADIVALAKEDGSWEEFVGEMAGWVEETFTEYDGFTIVGL